MNCTLDQGMTKYFPICDQTKIICKVPARTQEWKYRLVLKRSCSNDWHEFGGSLQLIKLETCEWNHLWILRGMREIKFSLYLMFVVCPIFIKTVHGIRYMFGNLLDLISKVTFIMKTEKTVHNTQKGVIYWEISCRTLWIDNFLRPPRCKVTWLVVFHLSFSKLLVRRRASFPLCKK